MPRLVIDLTSLAQATGNPVGIARCQYQYAAYARRALPAAEFTLFDPRALAYRPIRPERIDDVIEGRAKFFPGFAKLPWDLKRRGVDRVPRPLHEPFFWLTRTRRQLLLMLERRRLAARDSEARQRLGLWQERLMSRKARPLYRDRKGGRADVLAIDGLCGPPLELAPGDVSFGIQSDWTHTDIVAIAANRDKAGSRHVVLCHDIIPILFPEWYSGHDVATFTRYYDKAFEAADRVVFTSGRTLDDARAHCKMIGVTMRETAIVPLGSDPFVRGGAPAPLPPGLEPGNFALFVSTIEPRKNHKLLLDAWRKLIADGTIAATGYRLVFVGRPGWMMGAFLEDMRTDPVLAGSAVHLSGVDDATLATLYRDAGFCLYPPIYEGFGLPPVEALQYGKALIASSGGPMPEVVGDFAICLDPRDTAAWTAKMRDWIAGSEERDRFATRAAVEYRAVTWEESARRFFAAATAPFPVDQSKG
ncbi:MAG: glycosyltransferase family 4 protein [Rhizobiaceae bacterium]